VSGAGVSGPHRPLELARLAAEHLASKGVEDSRLDAELLLAHVLGLKRLDLYLQFERPLEPGEVARYREAVRRRAAREPLQYITGEVDFRELTLGVDSRVLIPRPETELLVGEVLAWAEKRGLEDGSALDVGTGSGAIALSLATEGPFARVVATDVSADALEVAAANAERASAAGALELRHGSLYDVVGGGEEFDVIVSNPPYVSDVDRATLMPEVRDHEPGGALFAGADGLSLIRPLVAGAPGHLAPGGLVALEVGEGQVEAVAALLREQGLGDPRVVRDLAGRQRMVLATRD
jgi:release factor glutamine methyltransferase